MQLIVVHGPMASGKLTTARRLAAMTGLPLFHNHLVVDAVMSVFPFGSDGFIRLRDKFWLATFEAATQADRSLIFTFAPEPTVPRDFFARVERAVHGHGGTVVFAELQVSEEEQVARLGNADRRAYGKLVDVAVLHQIRSQTRLAEPFPVPESRVVIDTTTSPPVESAALIADALGLPSV